MTLKITSIVMEQFRAFRELRIHGLGRVNLLTGRNNTGKSSVLEGLRILAKNAAVDVIQSILRNREEDVETVEDEGRSVDPESLFQVSGLFHGFPQLSEIPQPIAIAANGGSHPMRMTMRLGRYSEERDPDGNYRLVAQQGTLFGDPDGIPALVVETEDGTRLQPLERFRAYRRMPMLSRPKLRDEAQLSCIFVSPYGGEETAGLGGLWDRIVLTDSEEEVVNALRIIDERISAVSMVSDTRRARAAIVRANNLSRPVPLRSFGDGLNRLFGIILSLVNARGGFLLVDEFENGLHYSVQLDAWRTIFRLAQTLDIQVFATSHSWDTVESFQRAAAETPEIGVLIKLVRKGETIIPIVFAEDELAVATRDRIEVR